MLAASDVQRLRNLDLHGQVTSLSGGVKHTEPAVIFMSDQNDVVRKDWGIYRAADCFCDLSDMSKFTKWI